MILSRRLLVLAAAHKQGVYSCKGGRTNSEEVCLARPWRVFSNAPAVPPPYLFEFPPRNSHSDQVLGDFFSFLVVVKGDTEARREVRTLLPDWPRIAHQITHSPRWTVIISICTDSQAAPGRTLIGKGGREPYGRGASPSTTHPPIGKDRHAAMWMPALGRHRLSPTPLPRCLALVASDFGDSETETFVGPS
ncbi:hypothetical protein CCHR01_08240 [Colletotrichum chrysophilum]|uniref:Uncharacterized protein n=1 Tax=Colletotrichum chrysophilum TaxID=1836956 RepID=A0AAD9AIS1_9PEZI|nr:hypothetical protein CCHR01_08240 [Colletotrichum chrysophilum]